MTINIVDQRSGAIATENHERLLEIAAIYKKLSRKELARALGRDVSNVFPANGNPKLDYLSRLAAVLDWPVGDVAEAIGQAGEEVASVEATFDQLDEAARAAHRAGEYVRMGELSRQMAIAAATPDERALAALREAGAWDGQGRYQTQLEALRRGLAEGITSGDRQRLLQSNLANAYYTLGHLFEARAMARELVDWFSACPPESRGARASEAFAYYVLGHASRRLVDRQPELRASLVAAASSAMRASRERYERLAEEFDHDPWRGIANTCYGGIMEVEVEAGERSPTAAIDTLVRGVTEVGDEKTGVVGDRLESYGWWCVFGCNIALRHLDGPEQQRTLRTFIERGYEIAGTLGNWAMRERLFTLELTQHEQLAELLGFDVDWTMSNELVEDLVGTMGRFPAFRSTGWRILRRATRVGGA